MGTSPLDFDSIVIPRLMGRTFLDVGCGYGKWGFLARKYFWLTVDGNPTVEPVVFGLDRYCPGITGVRRHQLYDELVCADAVSLPFRDSSFDSVIATEVLEHIPAGKELSLLQELERVAARCVIVSTPTVPDQRGGLAGLYGFNPWEAHLGKVGLHELKRRGYRCFGVGFRFGSGSLRKLLSSLTYMLPGLGEWVIGVKLLDRQ